MIINLLPKEYRNQIAHEKLRRFFLLFYIRLFFMIAVGGVLLLPSYFYLTFQERDTQDQVDITRKSIEAQQVDIIEGAIRKANLQIDTLFRQPSTNVTSKLLDEVVLATPDTISFSQLTYDADKKTILIVGTATTRTVFLAFLDKLRASPSIDKVDSPLANLLKDVNTSFTITIYIKESPTS
jgi:hypothetical protein